MNYISKIVFIFTALISIEAGLENLANAEFRLDFFGHAGARSLDGTDPTSGARITLVSNTLPFNLTPAVGMGMSLILKKSWEFGIKGKMRRLSFETPKNITLNNSVQNLTDGTFSFGKRFFNRIRFLLEGNYAQCLVLQAQSSTVFTLTQTQCLGYGLLAELAIFKIGSSSNEFFGKIKGSVHANMPSGGNFSDSLRNLYYYSEFVFNYERRHWAVELGAYYHLENLNVATLRQVFWDLGLIFSTSIKFGGGSSSSSNSSAPIYFPPSPGGGGMY